MASTSGTSMYVPMNSNMYGSNNSGVGSNQWLSGWPTLPMPGGGGSGTPATFGPTGGSTSTGGSSTGNAGSWSSLFGTPSWGGDFTHGTTTGAAAPYYNQGSGVATEPLQYSSLAGNWSNFLQSQVGQGTGANPLLQQMLSFYSGGQATTPGAQTLSTIANQGISALPEWQSMVNAQQQNIQQNQAQLREQFASMGDLAGSPFGTAMSNYMQGTTANQNALLGQLQQTNILQGQIPAAEQLTSQANQMAQFGQSLLPAYNPLNQYSQQLSQQYAPMFKTTQGGGLLGGLLSSIPLLGQMGGSIAEGLSGGGGLTDVLSSLAGMFAACHVAASFYGWDSPKTKVIQFWMLTQADPDVALYYIMNGERLAKTKHRFKFKKLFDSILMEGEYAKSN